MAKNVQFWPCPILTIFGFFSLEQDQPKIPLKTSCPPWPEKFFFSQGDPRTPLGLSRPLFQFLAKWLANGHPHPGVFKQMLVWGFQMVRVHCSVQASQDNLAKKNAQKLCSIVYKWLFTQKFVNNLAGAKLVTNLCLDLCANTCLKSSVHSCKMCVNLCHELCVNLSANVCVCICAPVFHKFVCGFVHSFMGNLCANFCRKFVCESVQISEQIQAWIPVKIYVLICARICV